MDPATEDNTPEASSSQETSAFVDAMDPATEDNTHLPSDKTDASSPGETTQNEETERYIVAQDVHQPTLSTTESVQNGRTSKGDVCSQETDHFLTPVHAMDPATEDNTHLPSDTTDASSHGETTQNEETERYIVAQDVHQPTLSTTESVQNGRTSTGDVCSQEADHFLTPVHAMDPATEDNAHLPSDTTEASSAGETAQNEETGKNMEAQVIHQPNPSALESVQSGRTSAADVCSQAVVSGSKSPLTVRAKGPPPYGTFEQYSQDPRLAHRGTPFSKATTEFEHSSERSSSLSTSTMEVTVPDPSLNSKSAIVVDIPEPTERAELFSKAELDHLCWDASEHVELTPDGGHWGKVVASGFICPACGLIAVIYACKSSLRYRKGHIDSSQRMLRHSDFCFRTSVVWGIILWLLCFIFYVIYDWK